MSKSSLYWCNYCDTTFKSKRYLLQHQKRCKICMKYKYALFCCEKCGTFKTKGINNFHTHINNCTGNNQLPNNTPTAQNISNETTLPNNTPTTTQNMIIESLKAQLEAEKVRSNIYAALLTAHTNIDMSNLIRENKGKIHLFNVTPEMKVFLHDRVKTESIQKKCIIPITTSSSSRSYRRAPRDVESNPEPTTKDISLVINEIDKKNKETLNPMEA